MTTVRHSPWLKSKGKQVCPYLLHRNRQDNSAENETESKNQGTDITADNSSNTTMGLQVMVKHI